MFSQIPNKFYKNKIKMKTICKDHAIRSLRSRGAKPPDSGLRVTFYKMFE